MKKDTYKIIGETIDMMVEKYGGEYELMPNMEEIARIAEVPVKAVQDYLMIALFNATYLLED